MLAHKRTHYYPNPRLILLHCWSLLSEKSSRKEPDYTIEFTVLGEWIKKLGYTCTMEYYSVIEKNAFECVLMRWMNREPVIWVKSEREKQILYSNAYIWNLERRYWSTYLQGSGDTDTGDRLLDTAWEGKGEQMERAAWRHVHHHT